MSRAEPFQRSSATRWEQLPPVAPAVHRPGGQLRVELGAHPKQPSARATVEAHEDVRRSAACSRAEPPARMVVCGTAEPASKTATHLQLHLIPALGAAHSQAQP